MPNEEYYTDKIKELDRDIKKYRIMNNQKNIEIKQLKEFRDEDARIKHELRQKLEKIESIQLPFNALEELLESMPTEETMWVIARINLKKLKEEIKDYDKSLDQAVRAGSGLAKDYISLKQKLEKVEPIMKRMGETLELLVYPYLIEPNTVQNIISMSTGKKFKDVNMSDYTGNVLQMARQLKKGEIPKESK